MKPLYPATKSQRRYHNLLKLEALYDVPLSPSVALSIDPSLTQTVLTVPITCLLLLLLSPCPPSPTIIIMERNWIGSVDRGVRRSLYPMISPLGLHGGFHVRAADVEVRVEFCTSGGLGTGPGTRKQPHYTSITIK